jgi:hypothetical protein
MIPKILEYEDDRIKITPQAYGIPEIKDIVDKYKDLSDRYLLFVHSMSAIDSPYINIPEEEKVETIVYDITYTLGEIDYDDEILFTAIDKLKSLYSSPIVLLANELEQELHRLRKYLRDTPVVGGSEGNFRERMSLMEKIDKIANSYQKVRKQADEELKVATKGDHEIGEY